MDRKMADCRRFASDTDCSLTIIGEEEEVVATAAQHAAAVHGHEDTPEMREQIRAMLEPEDAYTPGRPRARAVPRLGRSTRWASRRDGAHRQEAREQVAPELVPALDPLVGLGLERDRVQAHGHRVLVVVVLAASTTPRRPAETSAWNWIPQAGAPARRKAWRQWALRASTSSRRAGRGHVGVPLEAHEPLGQRADQRVVARRPPPAPPRTSRSRARRRAPPSRRPPWPPAGRRGTRPAWARRGPAARRPRGGPRPSTGSRPCRSRSRPPPAPARRPRRPARASGRGPPATAPARRRARRRTRRGRRRPGG